MNECGVNKVDEWNQLPPVQYSVQSSQYVEIPCYTSLPRYDQAALEFRLDKTDTAIDPSSMFMHLHLQVVDENGKQIPGPTEEQRTAYEEKKKTDKKAKLVDKRPSAVNLLAYSLFSSVEVFISDQKINPGSSYYPWMCYVLNLLYQSPAAKKTSLKMAGWHADDDFDTMSMADSSGYLDRWAMLNSGETAELIARVMLDTAFPARVLPIQTEFTLRFNRTNPNLCLLAKEDYSVRIKVESAKLYALKMRLTEQALQRHNAILASEGVNYPMQKYGMRTMSMMKGSQNLDWVPITGVMPQKIYVWMVSQEAFNGKINKNPFNCQLFGLEKIQVLVNEQSMITSQPTISTMANGKMAYMNTVMNTTEAPFDYFDFMSGYALYVIDLTRDRSAGCNYTSEPVTGNLRILMDYAYPLKESIVVFCMAEFNDTLHIDANRNPSWI